MLPSNSSICNKTINNELVSHKARLIAAKALNQTYSHDSYFSQK